MKKTDKTWENAAELRHRAEERLRETKRDWAGKGTAPLAEDAQRRIHELQVHQIELEMQNEELQRTRAEVEAGLALYTDLYDFAPVGYFTLGPDGTIRGANLTGARILGMERGRLVGHHLGVFLSEVDRPTFNRFLQTVFVKQDAASRKASCEVALSGQQDRTSLIESAGSQHTAEASRRYVRIEGIVTVDGQECRSVMTDITERKQAEADLQAIHAKLERNLKGAIDVISETIEAKGPYAPGHHRHVAALTSAIARELGLTDFQVQGIELAAAVYDIGLMTIPIQYLQDSERLDGVQLTLYQGYPKTGHDALKKIEFPWPIAEIILQHRECYDGSGFPRGIKGEEILIEARILAVANALEDLTSHKSFRNAFPVNEALEIISAHSGSKYDPDAVDAFLRLFREKGYQIEGA